MFELYLLHGRNATDEDMDDWGFDGPRLQGVTGTHQTYGSPLHVFFSDVRAMETARKLTGWEVWDTNALEMRWQDDCVSADGKFYGDWGLMVPKGKESI